MEFNGLLLIQCILTLTALVASHGANLSPELYWQSELPNTLIPEAIAHILPSQYKGSIKTNDLVFYANDRVQVIYKGPYGKPTVVKVRAHQDPASYFFLEQDLRKDTTMTLDLTGKAGSAAFLPRRVVETIPFSLNKFPGILNRLSLVSGSREARVLKNTIEVCEEPHMMEKKLCATSLESMVDFVKAELGSDAKVETTEVKKKGQKRAVQSYRIADAATKISMEEKEAEHGDSVTCHKLSYVYAVFYCHKVQKTRAYVVPLVGEDGVEVKAVAICHTDTSKWNPDHLALQVLGVKPGTASVCHFLSQDNVFWYN